MGRELGIITSFFSRVNLRMQNSMISATPTTPATSAPALDDPPPVLQRRDERGPAPQMLQSWAKFHQRKLAKAMQKAHQENKVRLRVQKAAERYKLRLRMQEEADKLQLQLRMQEETEKHQLQPRMQEEADKLQLRMQEEAEKHQLQLRMQEEPDEWIRRARCLGNNSAFDGYMRDVVGAWVVGTAAGSSAETDTEPTSHVPPHEMEARDKEPVWEQRDSRKFPARAPSANGWKED